MSKGNRQKGSEPAARPAIAAIAAEPSGFFAFRTPLLPYEELEAWSCGLQAPAAVLEGPADALDPLISALAADRALLRRRLAALADRPEVREALFLASPSLHEGLEGWRKEPDGKKGQRAERALVRYVYRMCARATPFGLFSGCSLGPIGGPATRIAVGPRDGYGRHTRLDMDYLFALCEDLGRDPEVRAALTYRPNNSLYRAAGRLRYAEARLDNKVRSHHLVAVDASEYLQKTLERARDGARAADLAAALVADDPDGEISREDADGFLTELIDSQLLVSELTPPVSGPEAIHDLLEQLAQLPAASSVAGLIYARDELDALDAAGPGGDPARYQGIADRLKELPTPVEMSRLFQLDMVKPAAGAVLADAVVEEMKRAIELLYRLHRERGEEALDRFRKAFSERYEGRRVPLLEVLDEEVGIGFERAGDAGAEASPLLRGLALPGVPSEQTTPWGRRQAVLLAKLQEALATGATAIEITAEDLDRMAPADPERPGGSGGAGGPGGSPLPDAFHAMGTLAARSAEALAQGDFQLLFENAGGPSGARLLGRFCHADPELARLTAEHLRAEEALRPDAIFAEVIHLPQGRIGNILARPVLRPYEIPFLGRSGAGAAQQIPLGDLTVSVEGPRIVLRSRRLGREVIPRLTSAHNFWHGSLGVYRFLCMVQAQGTVGGVSWSWEALDSSQYLPRVTSGRTVLARAAWWMSEKEIKDLVAAKGPQGADRWRAVQEWRRRRKLPRLIVLADSDNELLVDLDNALSIETFLDLVEGRDRARLLELFPGPDELPAQGPEGRFVHEILIPFVRRPAAPAEGARESAAVATAAVAAPAKADPAAGAVAPARVDQAAGAAAPAFRRSYPPGSEWLYAKIYTGTSTADVLLREALAPVVRAALAEGEAESWFFLRYSDPEWHLRLRFRGEPLALQSRLLPRLHAALAPLHDDGKLWRFQLDTYEREIERYGGPVGTDAAERLFRIDSEAVLEILEMLEGDEGADLRWRIALRGIDALVHDFGLGADATLACLRGMRESFFREFRGGKGLRVQLDHRFRGDGKQLAPLLDASRDEESDMAPALAVLKRRSERLAPLVAELREHEAAGRLTTPITELIPSYVHMHVNRMIRAAARAHELVLYDFLGLLHDSKRARERKGG
jgi:thiopeptide-type bacteriocin biosynthesis protein